MRYTLAYPRWDAPAMHEAIQEHRAAHDAALAGIVAEHVTLVFPGGDLPLADYVGHVRAVALRHAPVRLACRCAVHSPDPQRPVFRQYLVPDEGLSELVRLHADLHGGPFAAWRRADLEFLPHLTIGTFEDAGDCLKACDQWNATGPAALGCIDTLAVVELHAGRLIEHARITLGAPR